MGMSPLDGVDYRSERAPVHLPIIVIRDGSSMVCTAEELSCSGLLISEGSSFEVGQEIDIRFAMPGTVEAVIRGLIVRIDVFSESFEREVAAVEFCNQQPHFEAAEFEKLGELLVEVRDLAHRVAAGGAVAGDLESTPLSCVLHSLSNAKRTGVLTIGEGSAAGEIAMSEGRITGWSAPGGAIDRAGLFALLANHTGAFHFADKTVEASDSPLEVDPVLRELYAASPWAVK